MTTAEIRKACREELARLQDAFPLSRSPVRLSWSRNYLGRGLASAEEVRITLGSDLPPSRRGALEVLRHEYAHLLAHDWYGYGAEDETQGHGEP